MSPEQKAHAEEMLFKSYLGLLVLRTLCKRLGLRAGLDAAEATLKAISEAYPAFPARSALRAIDPEDSHG